MMTTRCSAGCTHCPFGNPSMQRLSLSRERVMKILTESSAPLVVLSGGEPFEHPEIGEILRDLCNVSTPYRLATGNFLDLRRWSQALVELTQTSPGFQGLSLGTDVLTARCADPVLAEIWSRNLMLFNSFEIPYSITITVGPEISRMLPKVLKMSGCRPQFFYLRHQNQNELAAWRAALEEFFPGVGVIED